MKGGARQANRHQEEFSISSLCTTHSPTQTPAHPLSPPSHLCTHTHTQTYAISFTPPPTPALPHTHTLSLSPPPPPTSALTHTHTHNLYHPPSNICTHTHTPPSLRCVRVHSMVLEYVSRHTLWSFGSMPAGVTEHGRLAECFREPRIRPVWFWELGTVPEGVGEHNRLAE